MHIQHPNLHFVHVARHRTARRRIAGHWGVESMHWVLDVEFKDDLSLYRAGHGAKNMAVGAESEPAARCHASIMPRLICADMRWPN